MFKFNKKSNKSIFSNFGTGKVVPLEEVPDPVFSTKMIGDGYAIDVEDGEIKAPFSGSAAMVFPTGHALGLKDSSGMEILLHLGIDTVELEGRGFEILVKEGDKVTQGQLLVRMDLDLIHSEDKSTISMCIFTSGEKLELLKSHEQVTPETTDIFRTIIEKG